MDQADGLREFLGALGLLNVFADSGNERVLFFTFGEIVATLLVRDSYFRAAWTVGSKMAFSCPVFLLVLGMEP